MGWQDVTLLEAEVAAQHKAEAEGWKQVCVYVCVNVCEWGGICQHELFKTVWCQCIVQLLHATSLVSSDQLCLV